MMKNNTDEEQRISSKSPTIGVILQRKLAETSKAMNPLLTEEEAKAILLVYATAIERVLKENNLE